MSGPRVGVRVPRLTYIIDVLDSDLAGTENQLLKMIAGMEGAGYCVNLLCLRDHPWLQENGYRIGCDYRVIEVNRFRRPGAYRGLLRLTWHLKSSAPDIVHTFFPVANIVGVATAHVAGVPTIVSSRRDYGEWMAGAYLPATRFVNRWVDMVVANSTAVRDLTIRKEALAPGRVSVILNGINAANFDHGRDVAAKLRRELGIPEGHRVIGIVANFRPMKHHETFLLAALELLRTRQDLTFLLIGRGTRMEEIRLLAEQLGIRRQLIFTGSREDVGALLAVMDIGVNCSEQEGLSNAVMEYMAAGLPSIVTAAGGNTDLIRDGVDGLLFPLGDWQRLSTLLRQLLDSEDLRRDLGRAARDRVRHQLAMERMVSEYDNLYRKLTEGTNT